MATKALTAFLAVTGAIRWVATTLSLISVAALLVYVTASTVGRALDLFTLKGANDIGGYLIVSVFYLGLAVSFRNGAFLRVPVLYERVRGTPRRVLDVVLYLIALGYVVLLDVYFWREIHHAYEFDITALGILETPLYIPQLALGIGTAALAVQILESTVTTAVGYAPPPSPPVDVVGGAS